jgi:hypothetical protein
MTEVFPMQKIRRKTCSCESNCQTPYPIQSQYAFDIVVGNEIPPLKPILIYAYPAQEISKSNRAS